MNYQPLARYTVLLIASLSFEVLASETKGDRLSTIFEARCTECHGGKKQKAGLRLDTIDWILQGSRNGSVLTPGSSEDSSLYQRITLPDSHDERMPPKGAPLSEAQIELIRLWIEN